MTIKGPAQYEEFEYSDAGRAVSPIGLLKILRKVNCIVPTKPIIITENGVGDGTDSLRPAYILEHLQALYCAIQEGIPVHGYIYWTLSDNLEWTDGYGPKFGLVEVNREENLKRIKRESFFLYQTIIKDFGFTEKIRSDHWQTYWSTVGSFRTYWRSEDNKHGLSKAIMRKTPRHDWKFIKS